VVNGVEVGVLQPDTTSMAAQQAANLVARLREGNKGKTPKQLCAPHNLARK
jgi:hypothetical protein